MIRGVASLAASLILVGCEPSVQLEMSTGVDNGLNEALAGTWRVEGMLQSDCPAEWMRRLPTGQTRWTARDGALVIEALTGASETVTVHPVDDHRLMSQGTLTVQDCAVTETLWLDIHSLDGAWASGTYEASLEHDGSERCKALAEEANLPDGCLTQLNWQARRL